MIKVDTREKENTHILKVFDNQKVDYVTDQTCFIGDYLNTERPNFYVERKASILELAGNCGKQHPRFKRELQKLDDCGGTMLLLVEETTELAEWKNKHSRMKGEVIQKIIEAWRAKHNIHFIQTNKFSAPYIILDFLGVEYET